jgi:hypothetical protein
MTTPHEPAPETEPEVKEGDVTENPTKPDEDAQDGAPSRPHGDPLAQGEAKPGQMPDHDTEVGA